MTEDLFIARSDIESVLDELRGLELLHYGLAEQHEQNKRHVERAYNTGKHQAYAITQNKLKRLLGKDWRKECQETIDMSKK